MIFRLLIKGFAFCGMKKSGFQSFLFKAVSTDPVKQYFSGIDLKIVLFGDFRSGTPADVFPGNVEHRSAAGTDKMRVRLDIAVVAFLPVYNADADDNAILLKLR